MENTPQSKKYHNETETKFSEYKALIRFHYTFINLVSIGLASTSIFYLTNFFTKRNKAFEKLINSMMNDSLVRHLQQTKWLVGLMIGLLSISILNRVAALLWYNLKGGFRMFTLNDYKERKYIGSDINNRTFEVGLKNTPFLTLLLSLFRLKTVATPINISFITLTKLVMTTILTICLISIIEILFKKNILPFNGIRNYIAQNKSLRYVVIAIIIFIAALFIINIIADILSLSGRRQVNDGISRHIGEFIVIRVAKAISGFHFRKLTSCNDGLINSQKLMNSKLHNTIPFHLYGNQVRLKKITNNKDIDKKQEIEETDIIKQGEIVEFNKLNKAVKSLLSTNKVNLAMIIRYSDDNIYIYQDYDMSQPIQGGNKYFEQYIPSWGDLLSTLNKGQTTTIDEIEKQIRTAYLNSFVYFSLSSSMTPHYSSDNRINSIFNIKKISDNILQYTIDFENNGGRYVRTEYIWTRATIVEKKSEMENPGTSINTASSADFASQLIVN